MSKEVFVVVDGNKWGVRTSGSERLYRGCDTQKEAIEIGRQLAISMQTELRIQGKDGKFHKCNSYGNESGTHDINW